MDIRKLHRAIVDGLEDVKGQHISVFNTEHLSSLFERVIIASGTSNRQTKALAASVRDAVKSRGMQVMSTEGEENGEWIIVDCGAAVAHIMQPAIRDYYHLEEIWGGKSVRMKVGEINTRLVKASEPEPEKRRTKPSNATPTTAPTGSSSRAEDPTGARTTARAAAKSATPGKAPPAAKRSALKGTPAQQELARKANATAAYKRVAGKAPARKAGAAAGRPRGSTGTATGTSAVKTARKSPARQPGSTAAAAARKSPRRG